MDFYFRSSPTTDAHLALLGPLILFVFALLEFYFEIACWFFLRDTQKCQEQVYDLKILPLAVHSTKSCIGLVCTKYGPSSLEHASSY